MKNRKKKKYLLCLDIGNTNIVAGVYHKKKIIVDFRLSTDISKTDDEWGILFKNILEHNKILLSDISAIIICSVVPPIMRSIKFMCEKYFSLSPFVVGDNVHPKIEILYDRPEEVGQDRIVNAIAAYRLYNAPVIVVDFGTATTYDVISKQGEYLGGAISAGISISADVLFEKTAKLPRVELKAPNKVVGKNTTESMQSGIVFGYAEQVDGMVSRIKKEIGYDAYVVATGGLCDVIFPCTKAINTTNPLLTLEGLRIIYEEMTL